MSTAHPARPVPQDPANWTDAEIADLAAWYEKTGSSEYRHIVELTCCATNVGPERVSSVMTRRLFGRI